MNEEARLAAQERLAILQRARAFDDLLHSDGWKEIYGLHTAWVEDARKVLRKVNTQDVTLALDALQRWQLAEDLIDLEANFINTTLSQAEEIRGGVTLDEALIMERVKDEQQRPDPAGY
jgi:hypothetical protein